MRKILITLVTAAVAVCSSFSAPAGNTDTTSTTAESIASEAQSCEEAALPAADENTLARNALSEECRLRLSYLYNTCPDISGTEALENICDTENAAKAEANAASENETESDETPCGDTPNSGTDASESSNPTVSEDCTEDTAETEAESPEENDSTDCDLPASSAGNTANNGSTDCSIWGNVQIFPIGSWNTGTDTEPETPEESDSTDSTDSADSTDGVHPYVLRVVELVNEERAKAGLSPLTLDTAAGNAAQVRAKEIVSLFSHTRPDGTSFTTALKEQGVSYRQAGENIAWGQRSPEEVMEGWMNSSGHRANILGASFTRIGVGFYQENGVNYWTQIFY